MTRRKPVIVVSLAELRRIVTHAVASALDSRTGSSPCPDNDACDYASL